MFSQQTIEALRGSQSVVVLTGAGVSAESGVPTFRGAGGLWRTYNALSLATPEAFASDPKLVWEFYNYRREVLSPLKPNPGHFAIAAIEARVQRFTLVTQNIDNLHREAGSKNVVELHGNIWQMRCSNIRCEDAYKPSENRQVPLDPLPPVCGRCDAYLRPNIVWFGEMLNPDDMKSAMRAVAGCDMLIVAGTSAVVQPAASMPVIARQSGAYVLEVNPESTDISGLLNDCVQGTSGIVLPRLVEAAFGG